MTAGPLGPPWSSGVVRGADGAVRVADVDVRDLAATHGTPAYVVDEADLRARARAYRTAFEAACAQVGTGVDVYYAGKALLTRAVARWVHEEGLRVDTASGGELAVALAAGVPGADIGLHGNNKSDDELRTALDAGVGRIIVDSLVEVDRLAALVRAHRGPDGAPAPVMVRVTTGVHAGGHEFISTAHEDQKFGLSLAAGPDGGDSPALTALLRVLEHPALRLLGIHSHIGSQILDPSGFAVAAQRVLALRAALHARTGVLVDEVDLGGGYGIAYLPGDVPLDPDRIAKEVAQAVADAARELGTPLPRLSIEPGRAVVGPAGLTLYTVGTVKPVRLDDGRVRTYVSVDGGMSDNIRPALYGAQYHAEIVSRLSDAAPVLARVVGKHCESGDVVVHEVQLPGDVRAGDLLAVAATGAYGRSMASNYNLLTRPPVVAVTAGASRVLVRRETVADLLALDVAAS
ncbi:diaminopimelate decarboxylase [Cellulomonas sp. zg-ZUI222]|uniref:Diaminopimelate decarboxylase n=1 Tax=Cellulomonas wangleii TaxID=2816956 RepID=A0ABX8D7D4_9CELL|nr:MULTISPECIES: diaminopimelate decarboxylase [Cellulomonas]MBO0901523.1 diaminopimelate decarboxylase [Cellulomonas sp. zg-ZUI22]MBO0922358.1 diaminopimelate decarboxylase [Cellulomonas wangleii]MBO0926053.1 diaminopimelate decarboxylase [Cellulomonas wangleii]QVI63344.1 diaminopimelate decarboxylase [Cellulomonas wangleii]